MYKVKLWGEDKWNIHSGSYGSSKYAASSDDKKDDKKYNEQKYGSREKNVSSEYMKKEEQKDKEGKEKDHRIFGEIEEEKKEQKIEDDEIPLKAAKELFNEKRFDPKKPEQKKDVKTIEDAIKKAIEEEKKVIIMNN